MKFLTDIRLLLSSIWLGAALFFIAVAQSAFAVLAERELAGAVVNRTLYDPEPFGHRDLWIAALAVVYWPQRYESSCSFG